MKRCYWLILAIILCNKGILMTAEAGTEQAVKHKLSEKVTV